MEGEEYSQFGKDITNNISRWIKGYIRQGLPRDSMVEIVLELIVFRQIKQIAVLYSEQMLHTEWFY